MLDALDARQRERLVRAMGEVERLLAAARVKVDFEPPTSAAARRCLKILFPGARRTVRGRVRAGEGRDGAAPAGRRLSSPGSMAIRSAAAL